MTESRRLQAIPGGKTDGPHRQPVTPPEPLWRELLGERLRALRGDQRETLAETAERAGISPQYLSEVERGRKEPSSEMIAALAGALGTSLFELTRQVADELRTRRRPVVAPAPRPTGARSPMLRAA
ncbi:helix-turn-helix transcriptional regulator [Nocardia sp. NPDC024068]|uniref:helix-turn-helix domain-containing protein n=1 Tax=Nocardia sp. NPDC024068 TaxID=3157197 RepID=UPI00340F2B3F